MCPVDTTGDGREPGIIVSVLIGVSNVHVDKSSRLFPNVESFPGFSLFMSIKNYATHKI